MKIKITFNTTKHISFVFIWDNYFSAEGTKAITVMKILIFVIDETKRVIVLLMLYGWFERNAFWAKVEVALVTLENNEGVFVTRFAN